MGPSPHPARLLRSSSMLRLRQYCAERVFPGAQLSRTALSKGAGEAVRVLRKITLHLAVLGACVVLAAQSIACVLLITILAKPAPPGLLFLAACAMAVLMLLASALFSVPHTPSMRPSRSQPSIAALLARKKRQ